jgi:hypothetical protein
MGVSKDPSNTEIGERMQRQKTQVAILVVISFAILSGCATMQPYLNKSYRLDDTLTVSMGGVMILYSEGLASPTTLEKRGSALELVYTGITDHALHLVYREYSESSTGTYARPAFTLDLVYDLNKDSSIVFRDYLIDILAANSKYIQFIVRREPERPLALATERTIAPEDVTPGGYPKMKLKRSKTVMEIRIIAEHENEIVYAIQGTNQRGRAYKLEIDFIKMPDGTVRRF